MDREILFRGKRMDNGKWVEGWYCPKKTGHYEGDRFVEEMQSIIIVSMTGGGYQYAVVDPRTVCQYTGLTDKNGKKIFERDIADVYDDYLKIEWDEVYASFCFVRTDSQNREFYKYFFGENCGEENCEVIGNIFDNPSLLEGGAE